MAATVCPALYPRRAAIYPRSVLRVSTRRFAVHVAATDGADSGAGTSTGPGQTRQNAHEAADGVRDDLPWEEVTESRRRRCARAVVREMRRRGIRTMAATTRGGGGGASERRGASRRGATTTIHGSTAWGAERHRSCHGGGHVDDDDGVSACVRGLPLPPGRVPAALLDVASSRWSSPGTACRAHVSPRRIRVPDVEGALAEGCELAPTDRKLGARRFTCRAASEYLARLFLIAGGVGTRRGDARDADDDAARVSPRLSRFDLFHGHLWTGTVEGDGGDLEQPPGRVVGLLMHALEYPAYDETAFPCFLGHCQRGSTVAFDPSLASRRNLLWIASVDEGWASFATLDTARGGALHPALLAVPELHTTFEGDFGDVAGDVLYLHGLADRRPRQSVMVFPRGS